MIRLLILLNFFVPTVLANGGQWELWGTIIGSLVGGLIAITVLMCVIYKVCVSGLVDRAHDSRTNTVQYKYPAPSKTPIHQNLQPQVHQHQPQAQPPIYSSQPTYNPTQPTGAGVYPPPNDMQNISVATGSSFVSQGLPSNQPHLHQHQPVPVLSQEPARQITSYTSAYQMQPIPSAYSGTAI